MAGHSKWANIKHKKANADTKRGKVWTRILREISVATKMGGDNPGSNPRLRLAIEKASSVNIPKDNVCRAIYRGATSNLDGHQEVRYEGYGVSGAAVIVDCMTNNKIRTVSEVRHTFAKFGGKMSVEGSVAFMFEPQGQILFTSSLDEESLIEAALDAGAEDISLNCEEIEVICSPNNLVALKDSLGKLGFIAESYQNIMRTTSKVLLSGEDAIKQSKLLDALEDLDDTQEIYSNTEILN